MKTSSTDAKFPGNQSRETVKSDSTRTNGDEAKVSH